MERVYARYQAENKGEMRIRKGFSAEGTVLKANHRIRKIFQLNHEILASNQA